MLSERNIYNYKIIPISLNARFLVTHIAAKYLSIEYDLEK